jgi:hypothetical protein
MKFPEIGFRIAFNLEQIKLNKQYEFVNKIALKE